MKDKGILLKKLAFFIFIISYFQSPFVFARVASSSLFPGIRIINPAAISERLYKGYSVQASKKDIEASLVVEDETLGDINWTSITKVESVDINAIFKAKSLNIEFYASPQQGSKQISNKLNSYTSMSTENKLSTLGLHFLASLRLSRFLSIGAKRSKASSKFTIKNEQDSGTYAYTNTLENDIEFDTNGYGATVKLLNGKLHIGGGIEEINYKNNFTNTYRVNYEDTPANNTSSTSASDDELKARKTFYGIAFFSGNIKSHGIKLEASRETMPPLFSQIENVKDGEATIYACEMSTKLFVGGVSYKRVRGYYIDTYELVPFFLNYDQIGNSWRKEYEFSFTLKLAKRGSFGAIVLFSEENTLEKLDQFYNDQYVVNKKTKYYGLSYSYIF